MLYYTKDKELTEEYRLDRLKFDLIESQFTNQREALETLKGFLRLYLKNGFSPIINIYGQDGLGKTWLLKYFLETSIKDAGISYVALDADEINNALNIILAIASLFKIKFSLKLNNFNIVLNALRSRILDSIELKDGSILRPRENKFISYINVSEAAKSLNRIYESYMNKVLRDKVDLNSLDNESLLKLLPIALTEDIFEELEKEKRIVLIIDSLQDTLLYYELIPLLLAMLSTRTFIVVSTNNKIDWRNYSVNWSNPQYLLSIQLQPFQSSDIDKYLESRLGISTEEFLENVIKITRGKAFYLALFTEYLDQLSRNGVDIIDYAEQLITNYEGKSIDEFILDAYFKQINDREKKIFHIASLLNWFDPGEISKFFDKEESEDIVDNIISFPIVKPKLEIYNPWTLHKAIKTYLSRKDISIDQQEVNKYADYLLEKYERTSNPYIIIQYFNLMNKLSKEKLLSIIKHTIFSLYNGGQVREGMIVLDWMLNKISLSLETKRLHAKLFELIGLEDRALSIYREIIDDKESSIIEKIRARTELAKILFAKGYYPDAINMIKVNLEKINNLSLNQETLLEKMRCYFILGKTLFMENRLDEAMKYMELLRSNYDELISIDKSILEEPFGQDLQKIYLNALYLTATLKKRNNDVEALETVKKISNESRDYLKHNPKDFIVLRTYLNALELIIDFLTDLEIIDKELQWLTENLKFINHSLVTGVIKIIDSAAINNLFGIYEKIGDYFLSQENYNQAFIYYNEIFELSRLIKFESSDLNSILYKVKVAPKLAKIMIRNNDKRAALDLLIEARDNVEKIIKMGISDSDVWISYFNVLKMLGKVYIRLNNYERAIGTLNKSIGVANSLIAQYGIDHIGIANYLDTFKDLFRANLETRQYQSAIQALNKIKSVFSDTLFEINDWKKPDIVLVISKITRTLKQHLTAPEEFLSNSTLIIKDILKRIFDKIKTSKSVPENVEKYFGSLSWATISLAKIWYSLSMFNDLYELLESAIEALRIIEESIPKGEQVILKSYEFNLRLRRSIARFFSELGIEQVKEDLDACRNILAEIEGSYDPVELAYMKCSLILFDSRIKNSLKQFNQSLINLRDFISIISSIPPNKLNTIRAKELFDRAYKALRDIRVLTRGKMDETLRENLVEIERELRTLRKKLISK